MPDGHKATTHWAFTACLQSFPDITVEPREFDFSDPTEGLADGIAEVAIIRPPVDLPEHRMFILDAEEEPVEVEAKK